MVIRHDQRRGLEPMNQRVCLGQPPVCIGLIPHPIKPDATDRAVIREKLGQLRVEEIEIAVPIAALGPAGAVPRRAARPIVRVMPIEL